MNPTCGPTRVIRRASLLAHLVAACSLMLVGCASDDDPASAGEEHPSSGAVIRVGDSGKDVRWVHDYLRTYGYFENPEIAARYAGWTPAASREPVDPDLFDDATEEAVRLFQIANGLPEDGTVNEETLRLMRAPRCGHPDLYTPPAPHIVGSDSAYVLNGGKWSSTNLTYRFANYTSDMTVAQIRSAVETAMMDWIEVSNIRFSEVSSGENISIGFHTGDHGDGNAFDGNGGVLAHAYSPGGGLGGDVHFDDAEGWDYSSSGNRHLESIARHELGHSLGLGHSSDSDAVMYATYSGGEIDIKADDRKGIWALYGGYTARSGGCGELGPGEGLSAGQNVWSCDGRFQLVFQGDGNLVLYQGSTALWDSNTNGSGADKAIMREDGTLFVYKPSGVSAWSNNSGGNWYSKLLVQNDGNVVIYNASNQAVWSTGTCCR